MNHTHFSALLPLAVLAAPVALSQQIQETCAGSAAAVPTPSGTEIDGAVPAQLGSWFPSFGIPDGDMPLSDEEIAAKIAAGVELAPAPAPNSMIYHDSDETGMWLRARAYKAKASADGFEYTPFLGSAAPRNFPVRFQLDRAAVGDRELPLTPKATVSRDGDRFVLDRGPVEVIYDVALDEVEQSFALDVAGAAGDLTLEISVETDLAFEPTLGGGFRFGGEFGGMSYGTAIVLDGAGRQADVPATFTGSMIQLTVPAAFLADAQGQVIVDPVLGTYTVANNAGDQERPDIAYDRNTDTFIHVYEESFSGSDGDVFFRRYDSTGAYVDQGWVDSSADNWRRPSVANIDFLNRSLIACERVLSGSSEVEIAGRFFRYSVQALEPVMLIGDASASWNNTIPDVGGSWVPNNSGVFIVIWQRTFSTNSQLRYRLVRSNGTMEPIQFINLPSGLNVFGPVISKSSGNPTSVNRWNAAFRVEDTNTGTESVWNMQIAADGSLLVPPTELYGFPTGTTVREIDVSEGLALNGLDPTYLVSYDLFSGSSVEDKPIIVCRNGIRERIVQLGSLEHSFQTSIDTTGIRFGTTATDFLVSYLERRVGDSHMVYLTSLDLLPFDNLGVSERRTVFGDVNSTGVRGAASIASRQSGGLNSAWSQLNWSYLKNSSTEWGVRAGRHIASNGTTPSLPYCTSAPNSTGDYGFLTMYGSNALTQTKSLVATSLPPNSIGFFVVGNGFTVLTNPGGSVGNLCVAGGSNLGRYSSLAASSGSTGTLSLTIDPLALAAPAGTIAATVGSFWQFQCWHRDSDNGVPVSNFTNATSVRFQN